MAVDKTGGNQVTFSSEDEDLSHDGHRRPAVRGCVIVTTLSGTKYLIDLEVMMLSRIPDACGEPLIDASTVGSVALRRDRQWLKILRIHALNVGMPAVIDVEALGDADRVAFTRRTTTRVTGIEPIEKNFVTGN